ncbi:MAG: hypothetical protein AAGJ32_00560 [Pseudomonadota bacterium]
MLWVWRVLAIALVGLVAYVGAIYDRSHTARLSDAQKTRFAHTQYAHAAAGRDYRAVSTFIMLLNAGNEPNGDDGRIKAAFETRAVCEAVLHDLNQINPGVVIIPEYLYAPNCVCQMEYFDAVADILELRSRQTGPALSRTLLSAFLTEGTAISDKDVGSLGVLSLAAALGQAGIFAPSEIDQATLLMDGQRSLPDSCQRFRKLAREAGLIQQENQERAPVGDALGLRGTT